MWVVAARGAAESIHEGLRDRRQIRGRGEDRGVIAVVRRAEEDRLRLRTDRGQLVPGVGAEAGVEGRILGFDLVAMHERDDGDELTDVGPVGVGRSFPGLARP
jgi:hypothetical protein